MSPTRLMIGGGIVVLFALASFYFFVLRDQKLLPTIQPKNAKIVAFGDSLIEGAGATPGNDFVSVLARKLNVEIINKGRRGDTTKMGLERINEVLAEDPGIVILLLGGNDALRRAPKELAFKNLETIVMRLQEQGISVLLLGVRGNIFGDSYEKDYRALAKKYHTGYVSNVLAGLITNPEYMYDGVHPNDAGYAIIADRVASVLKPMLKK